MRSRVATLVTAALTAVGLITIAPNPAQAVDLTTWNLTTVPSGGPLTLDLTKVSLRGPDFKVLEQQADGTFTDVTGQVPAERDYVGTVEGHPDAAVAATVLSDGTVKGEVVLDRGITWWFTGSAVTDTRGSTTVTYQWPVRQPMSTDLIGSGQYLDEVGYDIDSSLFTAFGNDPVRALDAAQYSLNMQRLPWIQDAGITPVLGTVILRGSSTQDPYASATSLLRTVRDQWLNKTPWAASPGGYPDTQVQVISAKIGGGVAYLNDGDRDWNFGAVGGDTDGWAIVARHEGSHNFGVHDEHGGDPEGATIQSGNGYARYDSTELYALGNTRADAARQGWLKPAPAWTSTQLPPYATTAYVQARAHGPGVTFDPITADHSASGSALHLLSVQTRSALGASVTSAGDQVTYQPLAAPSSSIDTFTYVVADAVGRTATGVVMVKNLAPWQQLEAEAGTTLVGGHVVTDGSDHAGSGYAFLDGRAGSSIRWTVSQPVERDVRLTFLTQNDASGNATITVDGSAPIALAVPQATAGPEGRGTLWTPVTTTVRLTAGAHTITYATADVAQSIDYLRMDWADSAPSLPASVAISATAGRAFTATVPTSDADLPRDALATHLTSPYSWLRLSGSAVTGTAPAAGTYLASVRVTDASGLIATTTVTIRVTAPARGRSTLAIRRSGPTGRAITLSLNGGGHAVQAATIRIQRWANNHWSTVTLGRTNRYGVVSWLPRLRGTYRGTYAGSTTLLPAASGALGAG